MRAAFAALESDPDLGEPLGRELSGLRRIRVGRYRIVYQPIAAGIEILAVGPRRTIYVDLEREARARREEH